MLERQGWHLAAFVVLGAALAVGVEASGLGGAQARGLEVRTWVGVSWAFAGAMQAWIAFFWRMELHRGWVSRVFGRAGFPIFQVGFVLLPVGRFLPLLPIAAATHGATFVPRPVGVALLVLTTPPILWTFWSFARYMGVRRTMGADHFEASYREGGLERRGIFRYLRNPAYSVGLLVLYHAGLLRESALALGVAAAHHAFVWVAYVCTELPDVRTMYGRGSSRGVKGQRLL